MNAVDQELADAKVGTADRTADFDCDGVVTSLDVLTVAGHVGHACDMPVDARRNSWGRLKAIYR